MALQRTTVACAFQSDLSLAQMKKVLDANWPQNWVFGDSELHSDYLGGRLTPEAVARIYVVKEINGFVVNIRFLAEAGDPNGKAKFTEAQRSFLERVLPLIHAHEVERAETIE